MSLARLLPVVVAALAWRTGDLDSAPHSVALRLPQPADAWDEALAPAAAPCGDVSISACEDATHGACAVIVGREADECVPLFAWGVRSDGVVELASPTRVFRLVDLVARPLTDDELAVAAAARTVLEDAASRAPGGGDDLDPLAPIEHTDRCAVDYSSCAPHTLRGYALHYNAVRGGVRHHLHVVETWTNASEPAGHCAARGWYVGAEETICGLVP